MVQEIELFNALMNIQATSLDVSVTVRVAYASLKHTLVMTMACRVAFPVLRGMFKTFDAKNSSSCVAGKSCKCTMCLAVAPSFLRLYQLLTVSYTSAAVSAR